MEHWLIITGGALAGGLLVLHGFGKTKAVNDLFLETYRDLLGRAQCLRANGEENGTDEEPPPDQADEPAGQDRGPAS